MLAISNMTSKRFPPGLPWTAHRFRTTADGGNGLLSLALSSEEEGEEHPARCGFIVSMCGFKIVPLHGLATEPAMF